MSLPFFRSSLLECFEGDFFHALPACTVSGSPQKPAGGPLRNVQEMLKLDGSVSCEVF